jgi:phenylacetate-CoA ligase
MSVKSGFHNECEETASVDELRAIQTERLRAVVRHVYDHNTTQRARFREAGVTPGDIRDLSDLRRIPTMDKVLFGTSYPLGLSCVDKKYVVQMHMSSGSTGKPVVMPYTQGDLEQWTLCMARCLRMAGTEPGDVIQITPSFGLFNGGFGFYHGAEALGLFVLPTGAGNTQRQIRLAKDFGTRVITGVVSYGIRLMEVLQELGEDLPDLEIGIFGAETFSDSMKKRIAEGLGIEVFDIYGLTESGGVGLGMDCPAHDGLHLWEDQYIVEIVNPKTGEPVTDGESGELVITSLTREALPVIRFRTGDLTRIVSRGRCACGRTHVRIAPLTGRTDDMLIVKGMNFFPREVEEILMEIPGVGSNYQIIVEEIDGIKDLQIHVEAAPQITSGMIGKKLQDALCFLPKCEVYPVGQLPRQEGKAKRVFYKRVEDPPR